MGIFNLSLVKWVVEYLERKNIKELVKIGAKVFTVMGGVIAIYNGIKFVFFRKEQGVKSNNKRKEQDNLTDNKIRYNNAKSENKMAQIKAQTEAQIRVMKTRAELKIQKEESRANKDSIDGVPTEMPKDYHQSIGSIGKKEQRCLGFPWLLAGYSFSLVGPTNCGKSTFLIQLAASLAKGHCDVELLPDWQPTPPTRVLLFAFEQQYEELHKYYGQIIDNQNNLIIMCDATMTPQTVLSKIREETQKAGETGLVVIIDNYTILEEQNWTMKQVKKFDVELESLKSQSKEAGKVITTIRVFHTKSDSKINSRPITTNDIRGSKLKSALVSFMIYLNYCKESESKRILGFAKAKHVDGNPLYVLKFADTAVNQFVFERMGSKSDFGRAGDEQSEYKKVGRPTAWTDEECIAWYNRIKNNELSYAQVEELTKQDKIHEGSLKKSTLRKRIQRLRKDGKLK